MAKRINEAQAYKEQIWNQAYEIMDHFTKKLDGIFYKFGVTAFMLAMLIVPIAMLTSFSDPLTAVWEYLATELLHAFVVAFVLRAVFMIIDIILRIVISIIINCIFLISSFCEWRSRLKQQLANSFKV